MVAARDCDVCQGVGEVLQAPPVMVGGMMQPSGWTYLVTLDLVVAWPSSSAEWRDEFKAKLKRIRCEPCEGTGKAKEKTEDG